MSILCACVFRKGQPYTLCKVGKAGGNTSYDFPPSTKCKTGQTRLQSFADAWGIAQFWDSDPGFMDAYYLLTWLSETATRSDLLQWCSVRTVPLCKPEAARRFNDAVNAEMRPLVRGLLESTSGAGVDGDDLEPILEALANAQLLDVNTLYKDFVKKHQLKERRRDIIKENAELRHTFEQYTGRHKLDSDELFSTCFNPLSNLRPVNGPRICHKGLICGWEIHFTLTFK